MNKESTEKASLLKDAGTGEKKRYWDFGPLIDSETQAILEASQKALQDRRGDKRLIIGYNPPPN